MKIFNKKTGGTVMLLFLTQFIFLLTHSQINYSSGSIQMALSGTSSLHDWDMKSTQGNCKAVFVFNSAGQITAVNSLVFSMPVANLKSGKSSMDKNAYKALKTDANPSITYTMSAATVTAAGNGGALVKCIGALSIAGKEVSSDVLASCRVNADKSISVSGTKKFSMQDFNVIPPTFMMGTIKTGNGVVLNFNGLLIK